jgi:hypothetical protein
MTRRHLFDLMAASLAGTWGCSAREPEMRAKVTSMAERLDLAIIPILWTNTLVPDAVRIDGKSAGRLRVPEKPWLASVSPDCGWIAWALQAAFPPPIGSGVAKVFFTDARSPIKTMQLERGFPRQLSLSSDAGCLALTSKSTAPPEARLVIINPRTGELQRDLSGLLASFGTANVRLRISSDGQRLAVGARERFIIVDVEAGRVLLEGEGQLQSLSPDGDFVAFISKKGVPVITSLITRTSRELVVHWRTVVGFGPWSPDGAFLLAAVTGGFSVFTKLAVVDCATGDSKVIVPRVVEGDRGEQSCWVKRRFLT